MVGVIYVVSLSKFSYDQRRLIWVYKTENCAALILLNVEGNTSPELT